MQLSRIFSGWIGGLLGALAVVVLAILGWVLLAPPAREDAPAPAQVMAVPEAVAPGEDAVEAEDMALAEDPAQAEDTAPASAPEAVQPLAPSFDVVRIKPDGSALVAGRAEPGATVSVLVEGAPVAASEADGGAGFVAMFTLPPLETDRVMTLEAVLADGTRLASELSVIVQGVDLPDVVAQAGLAPEPVPGSTPEPQIAPEAGIAPETEPAPETVTVPAPLTDAPAAAEAAAPPPVPDAPDAPEAPATQIAEAPAQPAPEPPAAQPAIEMPAAQPAPAPEPEAAPAAPLPEAPRILLAGPDGVRVLQDPGPHPQLSIDAISYNDAGEVALAGRGQGAETLRIYLDNAPVGVAEVGPEGQWRAPLPGIDAGVYTLRVDSLSSEGEVTSRVETPFKREEPAVLAAAGEKAAQAAAAGQRLSAITVQPGHTLWAIAEGRYGEGIKYWTIFAANRDLIRDPDWIYPGQVFTLPDTAQ